MTNLRAPAEEEHPGDDQSDRAQDYADQGRAGFRDVAASVQGRRGVPGCLGELLVCRRPGCSAGSSHPEIREPNTAPAPAAPSFSEA